MRPAVQQGNTDQTCHQILRTGVSSVFMHYHMLVRVVTVFSSSSSQTNLDHQLFYLIFMNQCPQIPHKTFPLSIELQYQFTLK